MGQLIETWTYEDGSFEAIHTLRYALQFYTSRQAEGWAVLWRRRPCFEALVLRVGKYPHAGRKKL